jgi:hypothetical protein
MEMDRIEDIKFCLASADQMQAEAEKLLKEADYFRWRAAEQISAELAAGMSQRELAREICRSQAFVSYTARVWVRFGDNPDDAGVITRPRFQDAYRHVQKARPKDLDYLVPLATDDEDTREGKITWLHVVEPKGLVYALNKIVNCPESQPDAIEWVTAVQNYLHAAIDGDRDRAEECRAEVDTAMIKAFPHRFYHKINSGCIDAEMVRCTAEDLKKYTPCPCCYT